MFFNSLAGSSALSTIQISRQHPLGLAAARIAAEAIAADMSESYQLDCEWADEEETELHFRGSGVHGSLTLDEDTLELREFNFEVRHSPMPPDGTLRIP
ncbi:polyhydroxyalkanoic acid system family protein [Aeromonas veronii]|uniref:polyhydroxyalkanoic acid system family protein n=1 Tax=Aeromonas veronii TaxID=654 RepID=UPI003006CEE8